MADEVNMYKKQAADSKKQAADSEKKIVSCWEQAYKQ
jgi:hypothetical protein